MSGNSYLSRNLTAIRTITNKTLTGQLDTITTNITSSTTNVTSLISNVNTLKTNINSLTSIVSSNISILTTLLLKFDLISGRVLQYLELLVHYQEL